MPTAGRKGLGVRQLTEGVIDRGPMSVGKFSIGFLETRKALEPLDTQSHALIALQIGNQVLDALEYLVLRLFEVRVVLHDGPA